MAFAVLAKRGGEWLSGHDAGRARALQRTDARIPRIPGDVEPGAGGRNHRQSMQNFIAQILFVDERHAG